MARREASIVKPTNPENPFCGKVCLKMDGNYFALERKMYTVSHTPRKHGLQVGVVIIPNTECVGWWHASVYAEYPDDGLIGVRVWIES